MDFNTAKKQLAKTPSIASEDTDFLMNEAERCNETLQAADLPAEESKQLHVTEDRRSRAPLQKALSQGSVLCPDGKEKYFTGEPPLYYLQSFPCIPQEKKAIEQQARGRESESDPLAFNPSAASVLQRQIEANENAVLELAKADEEISQLNAGMAKLKAEYEDRLQDSLQRHNIFKEKVSRKHGEPLSPVCPGNSLDLHGEVCQLRSESRKLREANHRLNEENHWLQEELWDMRRQHERLLRTILNGMTDSTERGDGSSLAQIIEHTTEHNGKVDKVTCLQSKSERLPPPAHCRYGNVKSEPNNGLAEIELPSWEEREKERAQHSSSPLSLDSDGTDFLLVGFNKRNVSSKHVAFKDVLRKQISLTEDGILGDASTEMPLSSTRLHSPGKESRPQPLGLGRPAQETLSGGLQDDSDELSDDNMSSISQITNGLHSPVHSSANSTATKSSIGHGPAPDGSQRRSPVVVLPRRPFAPRSIADLKVGSLVKFSRPGGKISKGTVKYQGNLPGRQEMYLGVELEGNEVGKHNGTFEGIRCFLW
ncbi:UNVERIFIED_CONTAM: hypothetical protein FKN15_055566 [Acipenser sinensis]